MPENALVTSPAARTAAPQPHPRTAPPPVPPTDAHAGTAAPHSVRAHRGAIQIIRAGLVDYRQAWARQQEIAAGIAAGDRGDAVMLLEHPSIYTAGKRTEESDLPTDGSAVIPVDRGGRITWHGPGQLVGYPLIELADAARVVEYVQVLEQVLIEACAAVGVVAGRVHGRSGVWLPAAAGRPERKIAAIGIRITAGVTQHGFALNCDCDLTAFDRIVPCGIADAGVTSLSVEAARTVTVSDMQPLVENLLIAGLDGTLALTDAEIPRGTTVRTSSRP